MKILKSIGFGMLVWAVVFAVISAFIGLGVDADSIIIKIATLLAIFVFVALLARSVPETSAGQLFAYGLIWVIVGVILDMVVTVRYTGWSIFNVWSVWVGYLLILIVPMLVGRSSSKQAEKK